MRKLSYLVAFASVTLFSSAVFAESFKLINTTDEKMVKLHVSQDGKTWLPFDIGTGIGAGQSATMVWSDSAAGQNCQQQVKATYEDGAESEVADFDFCEKDLELEF